MQRNQTNDAGCRERALGECRRIIAHYAREYRKSGLLHGERIFLKKTLRAWAYEMACAYRWSKGPLLWVTAP